MPLPQVNDRLKEIPTQALRTVFATIGQLLLVADRFRARAAEQLSGSGESTAAGPEDQAPAAAPPATPPAPRAAPPQDAESARWRSLDKTGNVRVLHGDDEQDAEDLAASATPSAAGSAIPEPVTPATPEAVHAPVEYTPTEPVAAVPAPAEPQPADSPVPDPADLAVPEPAEPQPADPAVPDPADLAVPQPAEPAIPDPADLAVPPPAEPAIPDPADLAVPQPAEPAIPDPAGLAPVEPAPAGPPAAEPGEPASAALPVPNYDRLTVASLRARLRVLDAAGVQMLLDYEKAHEGRPAVVTMFERRLAKLSEGS
jgi:Meckel syndrome type 1 protein